MPDALSRLPEATTWRWQRWVGSGHVGMSGEPAHPVQAVAAEVGRLGCMQAQEFEMTLWSLAQRTGCTREEALAALASRTVLRTHALRPTWHFLRREDLAAVQTATANRVHKVLRSMLRTHDVDGAALTVWGARLADELAAGPLTRPQIADRLAGTRFTAGSNLLSFLMMWAELEQMVASGPPRGMTHTYQLVDPAEQPDREQAVAWLVGQFLASHGPSTIGDVCGWSSLTVTSVRQAIADLGQVVQSAEILGAHRHWIGPLAEGSWPPDPTVALLNGYDEYIAGLDPRSKALLDPLGLYRGRPGTPVAVLMVDGTLAGHWRRTRTPRRLAVEVGPLRELSDAELVGLEGEVARYAIFAGQDVELQIAPVR